MKFRGAPIAYLCCLALVLAGICGILLSPGVGVSAGAGTSEFTITTVKQGAWSTFIHSRELRLPSIENQRGLIVMNCFLLVGLFSIFGGVRWFTLLRRKG